MDENLQKIDFNEDQQKELLKVLLRKTLEDNKKQTDDNTAKASLLKELKMLYEKKSKFKAGDLIKWKKKLKNRKIPEYNEPAIILEILESPIYNTKDEFGSTYYNEKFDIKVGIYRDDALLTFHLDSNRFEKYE